MEQQKPVFCSECGARLTGSAAFCSQCGAKQQLFQPTEPVVEAAPPVAEAVVEPVPAAPAQETAPVVQPVVEAEPAPLVQAVPVAAPAAPANVLIAKKGNGFAKAMAFVAMGLVFLATVLYMCQNHVHLNLQTEGYAGVYLTGSLIPSLLAAWVMPVCALIAANKKGFAKVGLIGAAASLAMQFLFIWVYLLFFTKGNVNFSIFSAVTRYLNGMGFLVNFTRIFNVKFFSKAFFEVLLRICVDGLFLLKNVAALLACLLAMRNKK